ncbi:MAG: 30S ribosomal protein S9 [Candidatus Omnitrophica bacterium CG1_02_49_10]|nr:MAG: 30S ribosomal protein S9 [Candidatus Omnitrophica bacterium CG1_02_49_10]
MSDSKHTATGRRKEAVARVIIKPGKGAISVNGRGVDEYFRRETLKMLIMQPLVSANCLDKFDIKVNVSGGGISGQAGAVRHGLARALARSGDAIKVVLRKEGFLTRDSRMKERKKFGQKGARRKFQFTKR